MDNNQHTSHLGTDPIPRLLLRYALPSVVSMLVNSLYNIVDQIVIGHGVGYLGNGATTVAFPLTTIALALALLVGSGSSAYLSLELGRGNNESGGTVLGNSVVALGGISILFSAYVLIFLQPVLIGLGATDSILPYAMGYTRIIMLGMPFVMVSTAIASLIRVDGSPGFSMVAVLAGAVLNCILDPIFVFAFGWGVEGAAIATVISQIVSFILCFWYIIKKARFIKLSKQCLKLTRSILVQIAKLGSSSFVTQIAITLVNIVLNRSLVFYGSDSAYGSEIPLAAIGIVMKVNSILMACILGISIGAQPILGYNYSAGNYGRVKKTLKTEVIMACTVSTIVCILFMVTPYTFVGMFGDKSAQFNDFAAMCLRTYLAGVFTAGAQVPCANYFQAVGKPLKAMTLSMSRQIIFLIPFILIFPLFFGLNGILFSAPAADICAVTVTGIFISKEIKHLNA